MDTGTLIASVVAAGAALASAIVAAISAFFAWRAVESAERSNALALITEVQKLYMDEHSFRANQVVWDLYGNYRTDTDGTPISSEEALLFVREADRTSSEWKAVHDASTFWKYVSLLVREDYLPEAIAFEAFTSPRILGFLQPVERAFCESHALPYADDAPLKSLYDRWKVWQSGG
jgi:hypothetical protein